MVGQEAFLKSNCVAFSGYRAIDENGSLAKGTTTRRLPRQHWQMDLWSKENR